MICHQFLRNLQHKLYQIYLSCDVFAMLSENQPDGDIEGFGIAILEANSFGLPAIGAKGCGIEDAISKESGVLVDGDNCEEILQALNFVLENKEVLSKGAREWAKNHSWNKLSRRLDI